MVITGVGDKPPYIGYIYEDMGLNELSVEGCLRIPIGSVIKDEDGFVGMVVPDLHTGTMLAVPYCESLVRYAWDELLREPRMYHIAYLNEGGNK